MLYDVYFSALIQIKADSGEEAIDRLKHIIRESSLPSRIEDLDVNEAVQID